MRSPDLLPRLITRLLTALAPPQCLVCGMHLPGNDEWEDDHTAPAAAVCEPCYPELPWNIPACPTCAAPISAASMACPACELDTPPWTVAVAPLQYAAPVTTLVQALKFAADLRCGRWLARTLVTAVDAAGGSGAPTIIPVPMHPARARRRGFNHAALLAEVSAQGLDLPWLPRALIRRRNTPPQASLTAQGRAANLQDAFSWDAPQAPPAHVAIIDDVLTTGATARAVSTTLLAAGAHRVDLWCCARTPPISRRDSPEQDR